MGNWRRVNIVGTIEGDGEAQRLFDWLREPGEYMPKNFGPLSNGGVCGLPTWPSKRFDEVGNLAERDFDAADVLAHLREMSAVAPSLECKVHLGGDYESDECVDTVTFRQGSGWVGQPEIAKIRPLSMGTMQANLARQLMRTKG